MVLETYGHVVPEITLRQLCECDDEGTIPSKIIEAARHYNLSKSYQANLQFNELQKELARGLHPIVYLKLTINNLRQLHSVVVVEISRDQVHLLDPFIGARSLSLANFNQAWSQANRITIILE
jgi:ABC-type bacteriocin/lantibiotic exporter with double-glycine peptidase domain